MAEISKINKLLKKYKKKSDEKSKNELISYVIKYETEMFDRKIKDKSFRPTDGDEYHEKRMILKIIREELNLTRITKDQHPPRNIEEIRKEIEKMGIEQSK